MVQVSLGLAHKYGLLPFEIEQIEWAIETLFNDWLRHRGGDGSIEIKQACERIELLLTANEFSDRIHDLKKGDDQIVRNLLALHTVPIQKTASGNLNSDIALKIGERVKYIGADKILQLQYAGILEIYALDNDSYSCLKLDGRLTGWIEREDLQLVGK